MKSQTRSVAAGATSLTLATLALFCVDERAVASTSPVSIVACTLVPAPLVKGSAQRSWIRIHFRNDGTRVADRITFTFNGDSITDAGTFAPSTDVVHEFEVKSPYVSTPSDCRLDSVHFTDGETWRLN